MFMMVGGDGDGGDGDDGDDGDGGDLGSVGKRQFDTWDSCAFVIWSLVNVALKVKNVFLLAMLNRTLQSSIAKYNYSVVQHSKMLHGVDYKQNRYIVFGTTKNRIYCDSKSEYS